MATDDVRDDRIRRRRSRRGSEAVSRLCDAWMRAGADLFAGSVRTAADVTDDFTYDECGGNSPRRRGNRDGR